MTSPLNADTPAPQSTREAWLIRAIEAMRPRFEEVGMPLPEKIHVSVGFGFGSRAESKHILGQTWARAASADGVNHVFISPELGDTLNVLETLVHELIHVADDCQNGHKGAFAEAATRLGLEGPMTATKASITLAAELLTLAEALGEYPHGALEAATALRRPTPGPAAPESPRNPRLHSGPKTQTTRMLKVVCPDPACPCGGYTVRTTAKWLVVGAPSCPFGTTMVRA